MAAYYLEVLAACAPYNEETYMRSLQKRNPELYQLALDTTLPRHASN